ncbi:MAG: hypothetical protein HY020_03440 [Burkholderiales bacterium]|nr:hypothetical protein [Burkholderiales bacterium]
MREAMEITTFRLAPGLTMKDFIVANADVDTWLQQQPGFLLRRICEHADGSVIDMLLWATAQDGRRAASGIVTELATSPVHAAIDQATVAWSIHRCRHAVG